MSQSDSFIDEVTEEVRRDRLFALMKSYGWIGIVAVLGIVGGAAWSEWQKAHAEATAEAFGDAIMAAVNAPESKDRAAALAKVDATGGIGRATVVHFLTAAEAEKSGDTEAALAALQSIADNPETGSVYRQLAMLKVLMLSGDRMEAGKRDALLAELAQPGAPFRVLAMEQQALALLADGKTEEAAVMLDQVRQDADATAGVKGRVEQILAAIGKAPVAQ